MNLLSLSPCTSKLHKTWALGAPCLRKKTLGFVGVDTIFVSIQAIRYTVYPISCIFGWLNTHLCCSKKSPATILPNQYCGLNLIWPIEVAINWGDTLLPTNIDVETPPFANGFWVFSTSMLVIVSVPHGNVPTGPNYTFSKLPHALQRWSRPRSAPGEVRPPVSGLFRAKASKTLGNLRKHWENHWEIMKIYG